MQNDTRVDPRTGLLSNSHAIRGNMPSPMQPGSQATIQVIATGTAVQQPQGGWRKGGINIGTTSNMLKIGVSSSHPSPTPGGSVSGSAFKMGIPGKTYSGGSSSAILPGTTSISKFDIQEGRHNVVGPSSVGPSAYNRFPTVGLPNHHSLSIRSVSNSVTTQTWSLTSEPTRPHPVGVPYHPVSGAYVFDMGIQNFQHFPHLIRPPTTSVSSLPLFPMESQMTRGLPSGPVAPVTTKGSSQPDYHDTPRTENLKILGGTSFNIQNLYPNLQLSTYPTTFSTASNIMEAPLRPSILRKRQIDTPAMFPVHPSEKERISSPKAPSDGVLNMMIPPGILSPPHNSEKTCESLRPTNHSILSLTSDLNKSTPSSTCTIFDASTAIATSSSIVKEPLPPISSISFTSDMISNYGEPSSKKKPRKQLIITTEDKYGTATPMNSCATDDDEEFLKANETMKDITPPKGMPLLQPAVTTISHVKQLFSSTSSETLANFNTIISSTGTNFTYSSGSRTNNKSLEFRDYQRNGLLTVTSGSTETYSNESVKYYVFRRQPQVSILGHYKINTKAAYNHFQRYSDVKVKEEAKTSATEKLSKSDASTVWRLYHLSSQFDDLAQFEGDLCEDILLYKKEIPTPSENTQNFEVEKEPSSEDSQLILLHDLLQGNIQRCKHSIEQLHEAKETLFNLLEHKKKIHEIRKQCKEKTKVKKKGIS